MKKIEKITGWGEATLRLECLKIACGATLVSTMGPGGFGHNVQSFQGKTAEHIIADAEKLVGFALKRTK